MPRAAAISYWPGVGLVNRNSPFSLLQSGTNSYSVLTRFNGRRAGWLAGGFRHLAVDADFQVQP